MEGREGGSEKKMEMLRGEGQGGVKGKGKREGRRGEGGREGEGTVKPFDLIFFVL